MNSTPDDKGILVCANLIAIHTATHASTLIHVVHTCMDILSLGVGAQTPMRLWYCRYIIGQIDVYFCLFAAPREGRSLLLTCSYMYVQVTR